MLVCKRNPSSYCSQNLSHLQSSKVHVSLFSLYQNSSIWYFSLTKKTNSFEVCLSTFVFHAKFLFEMPKGESSKVMSILKTLNITDLYPKQLLHNPAICEMSPCLCYRIVWRRTIATPNSVSSSFMFAYCVIQQIFPSRCTQAHHIHTWISVYLFVARKQVLDRNTSSAVWSSESVFLWCLHRAVDCCYPVPFSR